MSDEETDALDPPDHDAEDVDIREMRTLLRRSDDPTTRRQAAEILGSVAESAPGRTESDIVDDLIDAVLLEDNDDVRATAINALIFHRSDNIDELIDAVVVRIDDDPTRAQIQERFEPWLAESQSEFRIVGARAMERYGDQSVTSLLTEIFSDADPRVQARAIRAYGSFDDVDVDPIEPMLTSRHALVQRAATSALSSIGTQAALEKLISVTDAHDETVRLAAVSELENLDSERAATALLRVFSTDSSSTVRNRALRSLVTLLSAGESVSLGAVLQSLRDRTGQAGLDVVANSLADIARTNDSTHTRIHAAWLLGELTLDVDDPDVSQPLLQLLLAEDRTIVELAAAYARKLQGNEVERYLQELLSRSELEGEIRTVIANVLSAVKNNSADALTNSPIEYTYVRRPRDYTDKHT